MRQAYHRKKRPRYPLRKAPAFPHKFTLPLLCISVLLLFFIFAAISAPEQRPGFSSQRKTSALRPENQMPLSVLHDGALTEMGLEDYLVGVVSAEMPADYQPEALKAQAVAARTYTLRKMQHSGCGRKDGADVCTDSGHCQAYAEESRLKKRWGSAYERNLEKIQQAVYSTAGEILTYEGKTIDAMYHASSGGHTENSEDVYKNEIPYLRGVESPDTAGYEKTVTYSRSEFAEKINKKLNTALSADALENDLEILSRYESGRVAKIRIGDETFSGSKFRGAAGLPSALFSYKLTDSEIIFSTQGHGHAVGMSQSGANHYAEQGWDYQQILFHYYTDVVLEKAD